MSNVLVYLTLENDSTSKEFIKRRNNKEVFTDKISSVFNGHYKENLLFVNNESKNNDNTEFYNEFLSRIKREQVKCTTTDRKLRKRNDLASHTQNSQSPLSCIKIEDQRFNSPIKMPSSMGRTSSSNRLLNAKEKQHKTVSKILTKNNDFIYKLQDEKFLNVKYRENGWLTPVSRSKFKVNTPESSTFKEIKQFIPQFLMIQRINTIEELGKNLQPLKKSTDFTSTDVQYDKDCKLSQSDNVDNINVIKPIVKRNSDLNSNSNKSDNEQQIDQIVNLKPKNKENQASLRTKHSNYTAENSTKKKRRWIFCCFQV